jgi:hypothetical protein
MLKLVSILVLLGPLPSCVFGPAPFEVTVDALAGHELHSANTYILAPGNSGTSADDLQFQEFARYLDRALQAQGFIAASSAQEAELIVVLSYGVHGPFTKEKSYSRPTYGQTGYRRVYRDSVQCDRGPGGGMSYTFVPTYGVTGYTSGTYTQTTYSQFAIIEAFDSSDAEQPSASQVWRVDLVSIGQRNDLRQGLPIMLAAAMPYIGSNSGQKLELELDEDDDAVQFLKGIAVR